MELDDFLGGSGVWEGVFWFCLLLGLGGLSLFYFGTCWFGFVGGRDVEGWLWNVVI